MFPILEPKILAWTLFWEIFLPEAVKSGCWSPMNHYLWLEMKTTQYDETKHQWLDLFSSRQALLNCISFDLGILPRNVFLNFVATDVYVLCVGHYPTNIRINLLNFVATNVYAFLCWTFSHKFTHNFVEFCRDRRLRAFVKILSWRLSSNPILSPNLSSTPGIPTFRTKS